MLGWFKKKKRETVESVPIEGAESVETDPQQVDGDAADLSRDVAVSVSNDHADAQSTLLPVDEVVTEPARNRESQTPATDKPRQDGMFQRLKKGLSKTRESFIKRVDAVFLGKKVIDAELLDELEEILITSDIGIGTTQELLDNAREQVKHKELSDPQILKETLKKEILSYLLQVDKKVILSMPETGPLVILVLGVNGVGKTTTIGKLAHKFQLAGNKVLMVAADTFRAAAIDQLKVWGERIGVDVSAQQPGADPSSVAFDALEYARNRDFDVIIIDTAGRLHTKVNLMEELRKIKRVIGKKCEGAPHEVMLVLDATTGQNAISQTKLFNEAVDITGLILTKLDGTAKGGIVVNISREFQIPIRFIGVGEKMEDLRDFDPDEFVEALFN